MTGPLIALKLAVVNAFNFEGRATRSEFWWAFLAIGVIGLVVTVFDLAKLAALSTGQNLLTLSDLSLFDFGTGYYLVLVTIPYTSLCIRRLHDAGMSGFWWLLSFVPIVGGIAILVLYAMPSSGSTPTRPMAQTGKAKNSAKAVDMDAHQKAMQGYALLFDKDKPVSAATQAARKSEISEYYRTRVLKPASAA